MRAEALFARPEQHFDPAQFGGDLLGQSRCAVRTVVVDDQHVGFRNRLTDGAQKPDDVLRLVVGRQHDDGTHGLRA
jgi:hypothetical protein